MTLSDVTVIDAAAGRAIPHQDLLLRGGAIAAVRPARSRERETRYAIPGLWDMHVRLEGGAAQLPLYVANGVTGVRDFGTDLKRVRQWEKQIGAGELIGPRIYASGAALTAQNTPGPAEARAAFNRCYDAQVDFIAIDRLPQSAFGALAEMSRHNGIPFAGLLPPDASLQDAVEDRIVSIEGELPAFAPADASALWDLMRRYGVRSTPMLSAWNRLAASPQLAYIEPKLREKWGSLASADATRAASAAKIAFSMARGGVEILAGSGSGDPFAVPGFELQRELEALAAAGLTPAEALASATLAPARLMRRAATQGQLREGFAADIVVLRQNPLVNITNIRSVDAVVARGHLYDHAALAKMLHRYDHP